MLCTINGTLLLLVRTNLYRLHILLSDTDSRIQEIMLMRVKNCYGVANLVLFKWCFLRALHIESHRKLMSCPVANEQTQTEEIIHMNYFCKQAPVP